MVACRLKTDRAEISLLPSADLEEDRRKDLKPTMDNRCSRAADAKIEPGMFSPPPGRGGLLHRTERLLGTPAALFLPAGLPGQSVSYFVSVLCADIYASHWPVSVSMIDEPKALRRVS